MSRFPSGHAQPPPNWPSEPAGARWWPGAGAQQRGRRGPAAAELCGLPALGQGRGGAAGESWLGPAAVPDVHTPDTKAWGQRLTLTQGFTPLSPGVSQAEDAPAAHLAVQHHREAQRPLWHQQPAPLRLENGKSLPPVLLQRAAGADNNSLPNDRYGPSLPGEGTSMDVMYRPCIELYTCVAGWVCLPTQFNVLYFIYTYIHGT